MTETADLLLAELKKLLLSAKRTLDLADPIQMQWAMKSPHQDLADLRIEMEEQIQVTIV